MLDEDTDGKESESAPRNKTGLVYSRLKTLIVMQKLPPRTRLEMGLVAAKFGVSTTPVREALIILAHEGIIAKDGSRTFTTRPLNEREVAADYEAAFMLVKHNLERNYHKFSSQGLRLLNLPDHLHESMGDATRIHALAIEALYERIANLSGNNVFFRQMQELNDRTTFIRQLDLLEERRSKAITDDMLQLIDMAERGDIAAAIDNLEVQLSKKLEILPELVREGNLRALEAVDIFNV